MKLHPRLLAIMAFAVLSTNIAVAKHHDSHTKSGAPASQTATNSQPKGAADKLDPHSKIANQRGNHETVTPRGGPEETAPDAAIDTRITVHQGREAPKNLKEPKELTDLKTRLSKKTNTAIAPPTNPALQHAHDNHQKLPASAQRGRQRNAIGAVLDHGATTRITNAMPPATTVVRSGHITNPAGGDTPIENEKTPGMPAFHRGPDASAIALVPANGLSVNGTSMHHQSFGTVLGGPTKVAAGVLSGSNFRPKHP